MGAGFRKFATQQAKGSHQVLDFASANPPFGGITIGAGVGVTGTNTFTGTTWPLLPNAAYRVFAVGQNWIPTNPGTIICNCLQIFIALLDAGNNVLSTFPLASSYFATPNLVGAGGVSLAANGDPLIEFFSNTLLSGSIQGRMAAFRLSYSADFTNNNAAAQAIFGQGQSVFSTLLRD